MRKESERSAKRPQPNHLTALFLGLLLVMGAIVGVLLVGMNPELVPQERAPGNAHLRTAVILATQLYLNRSITSAPGTAAFTYPKEYVTLNNTTTLVGIPVLITVKSATDCRWVTVQNPTNVSTGLTTFTNLLYQNVTPLNKSGAVIAGITVTSFKACGQAQYWINWINQGYAIFDFTSNVGVNMTATIVFTQPVNVLRTWSNTTVKFPTAKTLVVKIAAGAIWRIAFNGTVVGPTSCAAFSSNQICQYPTWTFASGATTANTSSIPTLTFQSAAVVQGTWSNWTLGYTAGNASLNTPTGAFWLGTVSFWQVWFVNLAAAWIVLIVLIALIVVAVSRLHRGRGQHR